MRPMRAFCLGVAMLVGCATAGKDGNGFNNGGPDAPPGTQRDAPFNQQTDSSLPTDSSQQPVDGTISPQQITLSQNADTTIAAAMSVTCGNTTAGSTSANSWYRAFSPSVAGVTGVFHVERVDFAVQEASGGEQVQVNVGTYGGTIGGATLSTTQMTKLANAVVQVPATTAGQGLSATVAADIPAGSNMYVEIFSPDHTGTTTYFYVGTSAGSETAPGYIMAADCGVNAPKRLSDAVANAGKLILTVTGTY